MLEEKERIALYYLNGFPGMYPARMNAMLQYAGSFENAMQISSQEYIEAGVFKKMAGTGNFDQLRLDADGHRKAVKDYHDLARLGIRMIDYSEDAMPLRLKRIQDPPPVLFVKGRLPSETAPSVSIIGSRGASFYGLDVAAFFGRELAKAGVQIISGMAVGIDSASQKGALGVSDDVFAVLGSGVDVCYPSSSREIYHEMLEKGGVVSEFNPGQPGVGYHFVIRNRIIAGLCDCLCVIEAAAKSGTSITVEDALNQGKDVFALPGRITDPLGLGCNQLIREGAMILTSPEDVLTYLGQTENVTPTVIKPVSDQLLTEDEKRIRSVLGPDPVHIELISEQSGIPLQRLICLLQSMEAKGAVRSAGYASYALIYR